MDNEKIKICPACGEDITGFRKCPYCGMINDDEEQVESDDFNLNENEEIKLSELDDKNEQSKDEVNDEQYDDFEEKNVEEELNQGEDDIYIDKEKDYQDTIFGIEKNSTADKKKSITKEGMSNSKKLLICAISFAIPGFGQIIGIIISIFYMSNYDDDKKSFGKELMKYSAVVFLFVFMIYSLFLLILLSYLKIFV